MQTVNLVSIVQESSFNFFIGILTNKNTGMENMIELGFV